MASSIRISFFAESSNSLWMNGIQKLESPQGKKADGAVFARLGPTLGQIVSSKIPYEGKRLSRVIRRAPSTVVANSSPRFVDHKNEADTEETVARRLTLPPCAITAVEERENAMKSLCKKEEYADSLSANFSHVCWHYPSSQCPWVSPPVGYHPE
jgi:hypothetical protein